ncbi:hypothetical protein ACFPOE_11485 [Caenimonas terrae]|uniref:Uncharacterized protein n=1 Tax=Caenimonas terrae TaxID=696074 RepID=A0ABW0NGW2_9BURK
MKTIALTGHPQAREAAYLQLQAIVRDRGMTGDVQVTQYAVILRVQAHAIHDAGGEVWHCGPLAPARELLGRIDRVLPAATFEAMGPDVITCLAEFVAKRHIAL